MKIWCHKDSVTTGSRQSFTREVAQGHRLVTNRNAARHREGESVLSIARGVCVTIEQERWLSRPLIDRRLSVRVGARANGNRPRCQCHGLNPGTHFSATFKIWLHATPVQAPILASSLNADAVRVGTWRLRMRLIAYGRGNRGQCASFQAAMVFGRRSESFRARPVEACECAKIALAGNLWSIDACRLRSTVGIGYRANC